jgi:hypothetical protein
MGGLRAGKGKEAAAHIREHVRTSRDKLLGETR